MREVGRVAALWRYPVKSMAGHALDEVEVSWQGFAGDRRWAFIQDGLVRSHFPWLTIRERPDMWHYEPFFTDPEQPNKSPTFVRTPSGQELDVADPLAGTRDETGRVRDVDAVGELEVDVGRVGDDRERQVAHRHGLPDREQPVTVVDLFDGVREFGLSPVEVIHSPLATHVRYRVGG